MVAVITAGGRGTRVAGVNSSVPKPMLPIVGKPVLQRQVECLKGQGVEKIIFTVGYKGDQIRAYFGDGSRHHVQIQYIEEKEPLGTAGALYYLKGQVHDDFFLINGDLVFDVDLHRLMAFHQSHGAAATLLVHPNDHPYDSGMVAMDSDGRVTGWLTKEDQRQWYQNNANAGIHVIAPRVLDSLTELKKLDLDRDLLKPMIPSGGLYAYRSPEYVKDMGTPERIAQVEEDVRSGLAARKNLREKQRAVFLDRDGTINKYVGFLRDIDDFELIDGVAATIRRINQSGYLAIVATNQPVIARGEVTWQQLREIHNKMETLLGRQGAYVDDIFVCPHHPDRGFPGEVPEYKIDCDCRKPKPGMLLRAAEKYNIDLSESWMVGDSESDMLAGRSAGVKVFRVSGTD